MSESKRVLIGDDEQDFLDGVGYWLRAAGYDPQTANDGDSGIDSARNDRPEVMLDALMPEKDEIETLMQLCSDQIASDIPAIMLSASLRDELRALDAGVRFFLSKPYDGPALTSSVHAALGQPAVAC